MHAWVCGVLFLFTLLSCSTPRHTIKAPPSPEYLVSQGNKEAQQGHFEGAEKYYRQALDQQPRWSVAKRNLGVVLVKQGQYASALDFLKQVEGAYAQDPEYLYFLGESYRGLGLYQTALDAYEQAQEVAPRDTRSIKSAAWCYVKLGSYDAAEHKVRKLYQNNPYDLQTMLILGTVYLRKKDYKRAIQMLSSFEKAHYKVVSADPLVAQTEQILLWDVLANAYADSGDCSKAQGIYGKILELRPFLAATLTDSAQCDLKQGNVDRARQKLEKAYAANPSYPAALYYLGVLEEEQNLAKAKFFYEKFLGQALSDPLYRLQIKKARNSLKRLEGNKG